MRETPNGKRLAIGADEPSDAAIAHLIFAEGGNPNPDAELLGSLSPGAIQRKRDQLNREALAEVEAKRAASPEGQIAAARAEDAARQERAELVELARRRLGWAPADVEEHGETGTLRAAKFEETPFDDLSLEDQAAWLDRPENRQEAERMFAEEEFKQLSARWPGLDATERASAAAHAGASSIAEVEEEMTRRGQGDRVTPIAGQPAAEEVFQRESESAKGGDSE